MRTSTNLTEAVTDLHRLIDRLIIEVMSKKDGKKRGSIIPILLEDDDILVVDKPSGIASAWARGDTPDLRKVIKSEYPHLVDVLLRIVHRLDKPASGVILLSKNLESQRRLSAAFSNRNVKKEYLALVWGSFSESEGEIDQPIIYAPRKGISVVDPVRGKPSQTIWRVIAQFKDIAMLSLTPVTGRTHQLRLHLSQMAHPIVGDPLYGRQEKGRALLPYLSDYKADYRLGRGKIKEYPLIDRLALHAWKLSFPHPKTGEEVNVKARLPSDLKATIRRLIKYAKTNQEDYSHLELNFL
jgi:RluA family pseudouridine synthase